MEIKFVKPTIGNYDEEMASYITEGHVYPVLKVLGKIEYIFLVVIKDDDGQIINTLVNKPTSHLANKGVFVPCDEAGNEITIKTK